MENEFDVIVLGTGLSESISAAALARAGLKVAHIDPNAYYGADEATLTLDELCQWADTHTSSNFTLERESQSIQYQVQYRSPDILPHSKQYSLSLSPSVIPSVGPFISSLVSSGVARYGSFKLLGPVSLYHDGQFTSVPQNKESIFQDRTIPLIEKRRLMRFLMFASGDFENSPELQGKENIPFDEFLRQSFSLGENIAQVVIFALAYCNFSGESTLMALHRVRSCLRSTGRYGSSPFLVGYYGGSGEIAQGFCRSAAVNGGVYILGRRISNIVINEPLSPGDHDQESSYRYSVELDDFPDPLRSSCLLSSPSHVPDYLRLHATRIPTSDNCSPSASHHRVLAMARCIVIVDGAVSPPRLNGSDDVPHSEGESDSLLVVFPPGSLNQGSMISSVHVLTAGPGTMSAPTGKSIVHLSMPLYERGGSSKDLLDPYLAAMLSTSSPSAKPLFQLFYMQYFPSTDGGGRAGVTSDFCVSPALQPDIPQSADHAAQHAERSFWHVMQSVRPGLSLEKEQGIWTNVDIGNINDEDPEW
ncbi:hypothetical protein HYDPIDRAFT_105386 [Hydnomerulius pinastri MD-312]|nr:hypothetical protein HYDPIDRAFT_105386 [Hydnomerulius pinastri MD-312]